MSSPSRRQLPITISIYVALYGIGPKPEAHVGCPESVRLNMLKDMRGALDALRDHLAGCKPIGDGKEPGSIRKSGGNWLVQYGSERGSFSVSDFSALAVVVKLVGQPNHTFELKDLVDADSRALSERLSSRDDVMDKEALASLHQRLRKLKCRPGQGERPPREG
jgi:hypothetical protein